jgi:glycosyltransferase involved in cell wall biosynthesis
VHLINTKKNPVVTVLMPVYNGEKYLREAISSILAQTFPDFEFFIINDGSTDHSAEIIGAYADPRIRLVHNEKNLGLIATLNKGLDLAQGEYIVRMDQDDISLPGRLERQIEYMNNNPNVGICGAWVQIIGEDAGTVKFPVESDDIKCYLLFYSCIAHPTVIMRKALMNKFSLRYEHGYQVAEDWELWQRSSSCFPMANIPEVLLKYRSSPESFSQVQRANQIRTENNIDIKALNKLGIDFTEEELELHRNVWHWNIPVASDILRRTDVWLRNLQQANQGRIIYPEPAFSRMLAERWLFACSVSSELGWEAWQMFWDSPLSRYIAQHQFKKMVFFIKCVLKWKRK